METVILIITNPVKAFNGLKDGTKFPTVAFIVILALTLINSILSLPLIAIASADTFSNMNLPEEQADMAQKITHNLRYFTAFSSVFGYAITIFVNIALWFAAARMMKVQITFGKAMQIVVACYAVLVVGQLVNTGLLYARGLDVISNAKDMSLISSVGLLDTGNLSLALYTFLQYVNPFEIWYVVLLALGLKVVMQQRFSTAILVSAGYWTVTVLVQVATVFVTETAMHSKGLNF